MNFQLTAAGKALFHDNPGQVVLTQFKLGNGYNYNLSPTPTGLQGAVVFTRTDPAPPQTINPNTTRYSITLDLTIGDFYFGEIAAYYNTTLVGVGVSDSLIAKNMAIGQSNGNSLRFDLYVTNDGTNYQVFLDVANSDNDRRLPSISLPDNLQPPSTLEPNCFIITGLLPEDVPYLAIVDNQGQWGLQNRPQVYYHGTVDAANNLAVNTAVPHGISDNTAIGELPASAYCIQFISGALRGYVRELNDLGPIFFAWNTPVNQVPEVGDEFIITGPAPYNVTIDGGGDNGDTAVHLNEVLECVSSATYTHGFNNIIWRWGSNIVDQPSMFWRDYGSTSQGVVFQIQGDVSDSLRLLDSQGNRQFAAQGNGKVIVRGTNSQVLALGNGNSDLLQLFPTGAWGVGTSASKGTTGQILTSQGANASPIWADAPTGGGTVVPHNELSGLQGGFTGGYGSAEYYHVSQAFYVNFANVFTGQKSSYQVGDVIMWDGVEWSNGSLSRFIQQSLTPIQTFTGATYVIDASFNGNEIEFNNSGTINLTVPLNATNPIAIGFNCLIAQDGVGQVILVPESGTVILKSPESLKTRKRHSTITLIKTAINTWRVGGDLEAL